MKKALLFALLVSAALVESASAQTGARAYAARMNASGFFRHDRSFSGAEVIYRSSGVATEADARRWWLSSPAHRRLILSGAISDVACVGSVCVGRGGGSSSYSSTTVRSTSWTGSGRRLGRLFRGR